MRVLMGQSKDGMGPYVGRASALARHNCNGHGAHRIVVHIHHLMHSSCKPIENRVYSRLLGMHHGDEKRRESDELSERNR